MFLENLRIILGADVGCSKFGSTNHGFDKALKIKIIASFFFLNTYATARNISSSKKKSNRISPIFFLVL